MKQYKKPLMKIVKLEKVDVLTASCQFEDCANEAVNGTNYCGEHSDGNDSSTSALE